MADRDQLGILKQGIEVWHRWRRDNPDVAPNLDRAPLRGAFLCSARLSGADLRNADLCGTDLSKADLRFANLSGADLTGADLTGANLSGGNFVVAKFGGADLSEASLRKADLGGADLSFTSLRKADLSGASLRGADLNSADLSSATLHDVDLKNATLRSADLHGVSLYKADLRKADLRKADLSSGHVIDTNFNAATLTGACLEGWNINGSSTLNGIVCDFIYLKRENGDLTERRPRSGTFRPGEFNAYYQKSLKTIDLAFVNGIDWTAFFLAFQELGEQYPDKALSIQAIEKKKGEDLMIRLEVPQKANRAAIEAYIKQLYKVQLKLMDQSYRSKLRAKGSDVAAYRKRNANLLKIVELLALRQVVSIEPREGDF